MITERVTSLLSLYRILNLEYTSLIILVKIKLSYCNLHYHHVDGPFYFVLVLQLNYGLISSRKHTRDRKEVADEQLIVYLWKNFVASSSSQLSLFQQRYGNSLAIVDTEQLSA